MINKLKTFVAVGAAVAGISAVSFVAPISAMAATTQGSTSISASGGMTANTQQPDSSLPKMTGTLNNALSGINGLLTSTTDILPRQTNPLTSEVKSGTTQTFLNTLTGTLTKVA